MAANSVGLIYKSSLQYFVVVYRLFLRKNHHKIICSCIIHVQQLNILKEVESHGLQWSAHKICRSASFNILLYYDIVEIIDVIINNYRNELSLSAISRTVITVIKQIQSTTYIKTHGLETPAKLKTHDPYRATLDFLDVFLC
jgi:hypothetical protein